MSSSEHRKNPHVVFLPGAGMGHLLPFCHLASALSERGCDVSFITVHPMVSSAESCHIADFFAAFPRIRRLDFHLVEFDPTGYGTTDPFFLQVEGIRRSAHLLPPLLTASSPPVSALVIDIFLAYTFIPIASSIGLPSYIQFISSTLMLSLAACFPTSSAAGVGDVEIPGLWRLPKASLPPALHDPSHPFTTQFVENGRILVKASAILINTFEALEPEALAAVNRGKVVPGLPPVIAIGPLQGARVNKGSLLSSWLDGQPARSVVYVSFGNRTATSTDQIKELGIGLERSGCRFLWVVKTKIVDREEEVELEELLGEGYLERVKERGLVMKDWVDQEEILRHRAIGGFLSHAGWNSLVEAALHGVRVLAWPGGGDQMVNAEVVARRGLGIWVNEWGWLQGKEEVVMGEEIGERVRQLMEDEGLKASAARLGEEAAKAVAVDGSSGKALAEFIGKLKM